MDLGKLQARFEQRVPTGRQLLPQDLSGVFAEQLAASLLDNPEAHRDEVIDDFALAAEDLGRCFCAGCCAHEHDASRHVQRAPGQGSQGLTEPP